MWYSWPIIGRHIILVVREREGEERVLLHLIHTSLFGSIRFLYCTLVTIKLWASRFVLHLSCCTYCSCVQYVLNIDYLYSVPIHLAIPESFTRPRCIYLSTVTNLTNEYVWTSPKWRELYGLLTTIWDAVITAQKSK